MSVANCNLTTITFIAKAYQLPEEMVDDLISFLRREIARAEVLGEQERKEKLLTDLGTLEAQRKEAPLVEYRKE